MNNFQEKLNQIENELNLKEVKKDDLPIQTDSSLHHRSDSGRGRNVNLSELHKKVNKKIIKKGGNAMISAEAAKGDMAKFIDKAKELTKQENIVVAYSLGVVIILEAIMVAIKVILTTRTNTKEIMVKLGIPLEKKEEIKKEEVAE